MSLPDVTHLQFFILYLIRNDAHSGRYLRERLAEEGARKSAPAFYQLMSRMEDAMLISGWYESFVVSGQTIKERKYKITPEGQRTIKFVQQFYCDKTQFSNEQDFRQIDKGV
ncbi:helix-turn-helix transcriptional regulator [Rubinisphaera italica]|uniref:Transcriptional regulator PadR-like family protein n=1 Tax=Rubinisphaera italica TaxID=2527969 RepID=A0A5C5XLX5_9PLAN|nr:helix-turn-helix transcriptional regulator [Rubinisphaera italica]TWT63383.1 Transcriptional regulator PadR-like family protein [Rubinisphaera italica]